MDINKHYESYRRAVMEGSLEGFPEVAKKELTGTGISYSTALGQTVRELQEVTELEHYKQLLRQHQRLVTELFTRMAGKLDASQAMDKGLKWFQFTDAIIKFDKLYWVPRQELNTYKDLPVFTTYEMKKILFAKPACDGLLAVKIEKPDTTFTEVYPNGSFTSLPTGKVNRDVVLDWTQELFYED